jgi:hypothetical protein
MTGDQQSTRTKEINLNGWYVMNAVGCKSVACRAALLATVSLSRDHAQGNKRHAAR